MVSFIAAGRAGNFFFTCAAAWAYAKRHGLEFSVPTQTSSEYWSPIYLKHLINPNYNPSLPQTIIREPFFHYNPLQFSESWRNTNIILSGYFQSPKYFDEYREEMLEAFALPYKKVNKISIHARYGDYLEIKGKHIVIDEEYLRKAMLLMEEKTGIRKFKVFSDNIPLFKERHGQLYDFEYSTNTEIMDDLIEISCCHSNIGSSSTFSWWGAYLNRNPNKVIVTQTEWFQKNWDNANTSDLIPNDWIKL